MYVVIIGAGVGGLCLAQGLKKAGIAFAVYERDKSPNFRRQGYRIHIDANGSHALYECLPRNLFDLYLATSNQPGKQIAAYSSNLEELYKMDVSGLHRADLSRTSTSVNRLTLREILLGGLDGAVHFNKTFTHYRQLHDGRVQAHFADGKSVEADLLVAADGANSVIRSQFLPHAKLTDTERRCIYGRTTLTPHLEEALPQFLYSTFSAIVGKENRTLVVGLYRKRQTFSDATKALASGLCLTPVDDYLMWALVMHLSRVSMSDQALRTATPQALHGLVTACTTEWHPALQQMLAAAEIPVTFSIPIRSAEPVEHWGTTNITLLGDAIHTMTPAAGIGANTALRDAELLTQKLAEAMRGETDLPQSLNQYETEMLRYGFEAVSSSMRHLGQLYPNPLQ